MSILVLDHEFEVKAVDGAEPGVIEGYGSVFNNTDQGRDIVLPGAFKGSTVSKVKMLWQHDPRKPIGVWDEMVEDAKGLKLKGRISLKTRLGEEAYELTKMGAIDGLSIGYMVKKDGWEYDSATQVRKLKKLDLMEVSLVTFPMNQRATVTRVKSATNKRDLEQSLRDAGFSISEAKHIAGLTNLPAVEMPAPEDTPNLDALEHLLKELRAVNINVG